MIASTLLSWSSLLALIAGFLSGILSALLGIGGAVVSTPAIRAIGASPELALGSTVPAIIPAAITGSIRYHRQGLVDWTVGLWCGGAGACSALLGAWTSTQVDAHWLMVATACLMLYSAWSVVRSPAVLAPAGPDDPPARRVQLPWLIGIGLVAGFLAGLLGIGGGLVMVPAFTLLLGMRIKEIVASSLVAVAMMSVSSLIGHIVAGHVDWAYALPLMVGVVPGAQVGSRFAVAASDSTMKRIAGSGLFIIGIYYLISELRGAL